MKNKKRKLIIGITALTSTSAAIAFTCPLYMFEWAAPAFVTAGGAIVGAVTSVDAALAAQLQYNSERLTSAIAILTKQKAVAANQINEATKNSAQVTAQALNSLAQTQRVKEARFDYGAEFGQGYNPCLVSAARNLIQTEIDNSNKKTIDDVSKEITASAGAYVQQDGVINDTIKNYQENYCTKAQADAGLCEKEGKMSGKSINIASIFTPSAPNTMEYKSKVDFINQLAGLPDNPVPEQSKMTVNARSYIQQKQQKDALISPALYSLKNIQNEYLETKGSGSSIASMFDKEASRYMGAGNDGSNWSKSLASQNQRGLLVELLKVKALDLAIQSRQYEQQERIEANLAVLVANAAQNMSNNNSDNK